MSLFELINENTLFELINENKNKGYEPDGLTDHDLGVLADWASEWKNCVVNPDWKRAYALIREGADLLLRRRARSSMPANISPPETLPEPFEPQMQAIKG